MMNLYTVLFLHGAEEALFKGVGAKVALHGWGGVGGIMDIVEWVLGDVGVRCRCCG